MYIAQASSWHFQQKVGFEVEDFFPQYQQQPIVKSLWRWWFARRRCGLRPSLNPLRHWWHWWSIGIGYKLVMVWLDEFTRADFRINFVWMFFFLVQHSTKNTCVCCKLKIYSVDGLCVHQGKSAWMVDWYSWGFWSLYLVRVGHSSTRPTRDLVLAFVPRTVASVAAQIWPVSV